MLVQLYCLEHGIQVSFQHFNLSTNLLSYRTAMTDACLCCSLTDTSLKSGKLPNQTKGSAPSSPRLVGKANPAYIPSGSC